MHRAPAFKKPEIPAIAIRPEAAGSRRQTISPQVSFQGAELQAVNVRSPGLKGPNISVVMGFCKVQFYFTSLSIHKPTRARIFAAVRPLVSPAALDFNFAARTLISLYVRLPRPPHFLTRSGLIEDGHQYLRAPCFLVPKLRPSRNPKSRGATAPNFGVCICVCCTCLRVRTFPGRGHAVVSQDVPGGSRAWPTFPNRSGCDSGLLPTTVPCIVS